MSGRGNRLERLSSSSRSFQIVIRTCGELALAISDYNDNHYTKDAAVAIAQILFERVTIIKHQTHQIMYPPRVST